MNTTVTNPVHRHTGTGFSVCRFCGGTYTAYGLSRHWNHCEPRFKYIANRAREVAASGAKQPIATKAQLPIKFKPAPAWVIGKQTPDGSTHYLSDVGFSPKTAHVFHSAMAVTSVAKKYENSFVRKIR